MDAAYGDYSDMGDIRHRRCLFSIFVYAQRNPSTQTWPQYARRLPFDAPNDPNDCLRSEAPTSSAKGRDRLPQSERCTRPVLTALGV